MTKANIHLNKVEDIDEVLALSYKIFTPSPEENKKYHNKDDWIDKINNHGLLVTAWDGDKIIGFSICYSKHETFHIWNVGVLEEYRRHGIWKMMYEEIKKFATKENFETLTLNTYKSRFPGMYNFVLKNGFTEYKTEGEKSFFMKRLE